MAITWNDNGQQVSKYVGRVVRVYNEDYRAMSDVYTLATFATAWGEDGVRRRVLVNANFECDTNGGRAEVDATPEVLALEAQYAAQLVADAAKREADAAEARRRAELNRPEKGKMMKVVRGRKVPVGTVGVVFWVRDGRVGLDVTGEKDARGYALNPAWVNAAYLEAV